MILPVAMSRYRELRIRELPVRTLSVPTPRLFYIRQAFLVCLYREINRGGLFPRGSRIRFPVDPKLLYLVSLLEQKVYFVVKWRPGSLQNETRDLLVWWPAVHNGCQ